MMTEKEREQKDEQDGGKDIAFLQKRRKRGGGKKVYLMAFLLLVGAIVYALWAKQALLAPPASGLDEGMAPGVLVDRLWIDEIPTRETDKFNFYIFSSEDNVGINDKAQSVYKHLIEIFFYNASGNQLTFQFPHDRRQAKSAYKVEKLSKPRDDVDLQLTLEKDPQNSGKTTVYYSSTKWSSLDRQSLPPMLRSVPLEPTSR